jgi:hypothetical protein
MVHHICLVNICTRWSSTLHLSFYTIYTCSVHAIQQSKTAVMCIGNGVKKSLSKICSIIVTVLLFEMCGSAVRSSKIKAIKDKGREEMRREETGCGGECQSLKLSHLI